MVSWPLAVVMSTSRRVPIPWARVWRSPSLLIATVGGVGLFPKAPGTIGSLVALPLVWWILMSFNGGALWLLFVGSCVLGAWACDEAGRQVGVSDHGSFVVDEVLGIFVTLWPAVYLLGPDALSPLALTVAFLAFRLFDILKPWPVSWFDTSIKGGVGVMLDDLVAGVLAAPFVVLALVFTALM